MVGLLFPCNTLEAFVLPSARKAQFCSPARALAGIWHMLGRQTTAPHWERHSVTAVGAMHQPAPFGKAFSRRAQGGVSTRGASALLRLFSGIAQPLADVASPPPARTRRTLPGCC